MTGGRKKGRSSPRASTRRDEGGWQDVRPASGSRHDSACGEEIGEGHTWTGPGRRANGSGP
jgi:hypothetical protein